MAAGEKTMLAARLHNPSDMRLEQVDFPPSPKKGEALIRVLKSGICGSDLHIFKNGRIGDTIVDSPMIIGHEFCGVVEEVGDDAYDGNYSLLKAGTRVAIDPARPCYHCEQCRKGNPNLCVNLQFCGNYPCDGCFCEYLITPSRCCFPLPEEISDVEGVLLEPLGVAIHSVDLAYIKPAYSAAIYGAGPIGLLILQVARLAGADPVYIVDRYDWRLELASEFGGIPINCEKESPIKRIMSETSGRGVDVAFEAAFGEETNNLAAESVCNGGRIVLTGIPEDDKLLIRHSTAR
jgi:L-iditol 2-dehydrogenase